MNLFHFSHFHRWLSFLKVLDANTYKWRVRGHNCNLHTFHTLSTFHNLYTFQNFYTLHTFYTTGKGLVRFEVN